MSLRVDFLAGAETDSQAAFNRLEEAREGLGVKFTEAVDRYLARIADFPHIAPVYLRRLRRQVMQWFPYGIFYEPYTTRIVVVALLDLRQDERTIRRRLRGQ